VVLRVPQHGFLNQPKAYARRLDKSRCAVNDVTEDYEHETDHGGRLVSAESTWGFTEDL
jgi:hypothetical protein